jgi:hypothetical protein
VRVQHKMLDQYFTVSFHSCDLRLGAGRLSLQADRASSSERRADSLPHQHWREVAGKDLYPLVRLLLPDVCSSASLTSSDRS